MKEYKKKFIEFMVRSKVLTFGDFTTKSGRKTPFFINTGNYNDGQQITKLGHFYAEFIVENQLHQNATVLYGPAYKGIPLCLTTAIALQNHYDCNLHFSFNRKEVKMHGESGQIVGHQLTKQDKIIIVEDVITAGTALYENLPLINFFGSKVEAVVIAVDRMEKGQNNISAIDEIYQQFGIIIYAIVTIKEIVDYLSKNVVDSRLIIDEKLMKKIENYYKQYGV